MWLILARLMKLGVLGPDSGFYMYRSTSLWQGQAYQESLQRGHDCRYACSGVCKSATSDSSGCCVVTLYPIFGRRSHDVRNTPVGGAGVPRRSVIRDNTGDRQRPLKVLKCPERTLNVQALDSRLGNYLCQGCTPSKSSLAAKAPQASLKSRECPCLFAELISK